MMFDRLKKNKFHTKCKAQIKLTMARIEMIKKKRNAMQRYLKDDISDLLRNGLDVNAYGRAEGLLLELNLSSCYDCLEQFCVQISNNLETMNNERECPEDCKEAVSSLMVAAARVADLPELRELRTIFAGRYGNSLDPYANQVFVEKLKSTPPTKDMKLQLLQGIATEIGLNWNASEMKQKLFASPALQQDLAKNRTDNELKTHGNADNAVQNPRHRNGTLESAESNGFVERKDKHKQHPSARESKPKPKSVRRNAKAASDGESGKDHKDAEPRNKDNHNQQPDEEERMMDKLLDHYSKKKSPYGTGKTEPGLKPPPQQDPAVSARVPRWGSWEGSSTEATSETKMRHARSSSLDPTGHVHPKLPDYDDFVARLAALREGN